MHPRYVIRLKPADAGRRVSLRLRTHAGPGQPATTDVVGTLAGWDGGVLTVRRRDGSVRCVHEGDLLAARVLPADPAGGVARSGGCDDIRRAAEPDQPPPC